MKWSNSSQLELNSDEVHLLVWNVPNEVVNGLRVDCFERRIGISEEHFNVLINTLRQVPMSEITVLEVVEVAAIRNALEITLAELGEAEFQTRTGHKFETGRRLLHNMDVFLGQTSRL